MKCAKYTCKEIIVKSLICYSLAIAALLLGFFIDLALLGSLFGVSRKVDSTMTNQENTVVILGNKKFNGSMSQLNEYDVEKSKLEQLKRSSSFDVFFHSTVHIFIIVVVSALSLLSCMWLISVSPHSKAVAEEMVIAKNQNYLSQFIFTDTSVTFPTSDSTLATFTYLDIAGIIHESSYITIIGPSRHTFNLESFPTLSDYQVFVESLKKNLFSGNTSLVHSD
jgi:hypothetical protein